MAGIVFPTSKDIYLEANGQKLAVVESYRARSTQESSFVEAFGEQEAVGTVGGKIQHTIELSRVYVTGGTQGDGINFFNLHGFNLVIVKPDKRIIYSGCEWTDIDEEAGLNHTILEKVSLMAAKRMEMAVS